MRHRLQNGLLFGGRFLCVQCLRWEFGFIRLPGRYWSPKTPVFLVCESSIRDPEHAPDLIRGAA
jgi:hypothetical protein